MADIPIETEAMLIAGVKASIAPDRLPDLLEAVQKYLTDRHKQYRRRYELVHETDDAGYFLVEPGHWMEIGDAVGFDDREVDAVRRAHNRQLLHEGRRVGRREEFESALDVRETVVVGF